MGEVLLDELNLFADRAKDWKSESHLRNEGAEPLVEFHRNGEHSLTMFMKVDAPTEAVARASQFGCWGFAPDQMFTSWEIGPTSDGRYGLVCAGVDRDHGHLVLFPYRLVSVNNNRTRRLRWEKREHADVRALRGMIDCIRETNIHEKMLVDPRWQEVVEKIPDEEERVATLDAHIAHFMGVMMPCVRGVMMMAEADSARCRIWQAVMGDPTASFTLQELLRDQEEGLTAQDLSDIEKLLREHAPE